MAKNRSKISTTIAGTGPGIPDEALAPGEELPTPPSEKEVRRVAAKLGVPGAKGGKPSRDMLAGVAVGVGSAAIVAALLYTTRFNRKK